MRRRSGDYPLKSERLQILSWGSEYTPFFSPPRSPMKTLLSVLALALVLPLAACESEPADDTLVAEPDAIVTTPPADDMMMADTTAAVSAQGTLDAVQSAGGLTNLAPSAALSNIDGWISQLEGNADAAPVVENLRTLRSQLQEDPLNGSAIGQTLVTLGEQTTAAAAGDTALEQLGEALTSAGQGLMNM